MRSKCLQRSLASVSAVSNSSWHVEAEAEAARWSFMGGEKMKMTMPHLKRILEDAVPIFNMGSMLVLGDLGTNLPLAVAEIAQSHTVTTF